jgi:hypothetical protein
MLGLLCLIIGRFALCTINPIFWVLETNIAAMALGLISAYFLSADQSAKDRTGNYNSMNIVQPYRFLIRLYLLMPK